MLKRVQAATGRVVPDQSGKVITGPIVVDTAATYYKRRLAAGDLVLFTRPKVKKDADK